MEPNTKSEHQKRVEEFMKLAGQEVKESPGIPSEEVRVLRAKLILEEALETIDGLGVRILIDELKTIHLDYFDFTKHAILSFRADKEPNLIELADGCADLKVVTTGTLSACGIADEKLQRVVDESNLAKFEVPNCLDCNKPLSFISPQEDPTTTEGYWACINGEEGGVHPPLVASSGGYRRADGKWIKPASWQPPNIGYAIGLPSEQEAAYLREMHEDTGMMDDDEDDD